MSTTKLACNVSYIKFSLIETLINKFYKMIIDNNFAPFKEYLIGHIERLEKENPSASQKVLDTLDELRNQILFAHEVNDINGFANKIDVLITRNRLKLKK